MMYKMSHMEGRTGEHFTHVGPFMKYPEIQAFLFQIDLFSLVFTRHKEGSGPLTAGSSPLVASSVSQTFIRHPDVWRIRCLQEFLKSISGKSQQANALPRSRSSASSFIRGTSGGDNNVPQPYFLTKSTCLYGLITTLMLVYQSFKFDIS